VAVASNAPTSSPPTFPLPPGTACRQAPAPKDTATTTGPGRRYPPPRPARRPSLAADPPQPAHRRARLLSLLVTAGRRPERPRLGRRTPLEDRRIVPGREDRPRPGPAPNLALDRLAPLDHPGDPRPRLPRRRHRPPNPAAAARADPVDRQRVTPPVQRPDHRTRPTPHRPTRLVHPTTPPPSPSHGQPLRQTSPHRTMITIPGWSTSTPAALSGSESALVVAGSGAVFDAGAVTTAIVLCRLPGSCLWIL
jgi:hypothetical protein